MSIFISLILVLNKVNDTYLVYDSDNHYFIRKTLLNSYKFFDIYNLNYIHDIFDKRKIQICLDNAKLFW